MSGWSSLRCGSSQRLPGGGGATAVKPKEVLVAVGVGKVAVEKVLQNLGRHLPLVHFITVDGLVRRDLDRGAAPPRPHHPGHVRDAGEAAVAAPLVRQVGAVVDVDGLASGERPVVI